MNTVHALMAIVGVAGVTLAAGYAVVSLAAVIVWNLRRKDRPSLQCQPVTILKPLCGAEPGLYENLRSFCQQRYPEYEIVFGVRDPRDPALGVVQRLQAEFPALRIDVVAD